MKIMQLISRKAMVIAICLFAGQTFGQAPSITYSNNSQSYIIGAPVTALTPNVSGTIFSMGQTSTVAGNTSGGYVNATGTSAAFNHPIGVAVDAIGNIYVADRLNYRIRKINTSGVVSLFAGNGSSGYINANGGSASFALPNDVSVDASGNVYVADEWNNMIRIINSTGDVTPFAGSTNAGYVNATGTSARFSYPFGICIDAAGNNYVADLNNGAVRKIDPSGAVTTLASGFGTVLDVACDAAGYVYVADANNHVIYKISPGGTISILAGSGSAGYADGTGTLASFNHPAGITLDPSGNVYVGDEINQMIRKITPAGEVTKVVGTSSPGSLDGPGTSASLNNPCGVAYDARTGSVIVADYSNNLIRRVAVAPFTISPALPAGLSFDNATGIISGTPIASSAPVTYTITAYNSYGGGSTQVTIGVSSAIATPSDENFLLTFTPRVEISDAAQLGSKGAGDVNQSITYFDGLGRPMQNVTLKGNGDGTKDLVQPIAYDEFGREDKKYLPYSTATGDPLSYRNDALNANAGVYQFYNPTAVAPGSGMSGVQQLDGSGHAIGVVTIPTPYAQTGFEPSPLDRPTEQGAPGDPWQLTTSGISGSGNTIKTTYGTNNFTEVLFWTISPTGGASNNGNYYDVNQLYKTTTTDERNFSASEFKDKLGHVVCKTVQADASTYLNTYYIYDDYGNLAYVIPPLSGTYPGSFSELATDNVFNNYIYAYHYDSRNRLTEKKLPGKGWEVTVYNKLDQVVMTQDAVQRGKSPQQWTFTKYDALGRVITTGIYNDDQHGGQANTNYRDAFQIISDTWYTTFWEDRTSSGYTNNCLPQGNIAAKLTEHYYDDYNIPNNPYAPWPTNTMPIPRGLPTATKVAILNYDGTISANMLWETTYFDDKGRPFQTSKQHYLGGVSSYDPGNYDVNFYAYNFDDQVNSNIRYHIVQNSINLKLANTYYYDHVGRPNKTYLSINDALPAVQLNQIDYNETGQPYKRHLHNTGNGFLQDVVYTYNERGWLRTYNTFNNNNPNQLFNLELQYNTGINKFYNGNIAYQLWQSYGQAAKSYSYDYDALDRLTSGVGSDGNSETGITYDYLGNLLTLNRSGGTNAISLSYDSYNGNQLTLVDKLISGMPSVYRNYSTYDANGNAPSDGQNHNISYNMLNLPASVDMGSYHINYTYDATGRKIKKESNAPTVDYIDGIQYSSGNNIDFVQTADGRVINPTTTPNFEYDLKDHLGNTRVTFDSFSGGIVGTQVNDYYPFGLVSYQPNVSNPQNKYLYNNKELQDGINQYDYGARFYDPVIARWTSVDPLAEKYRRWSTYNYAVNNPMRFTDPDGMGVSAVDDAAIDNQKAAIANWHLMHDLTAAERAFGAYDEMEADPSDNQQQSGQNGGQSTDGGKGKTDSKPNQTAERAKAQVKKVASTANDVATYVTYVPSFVFFTKKGMVVVRQGLPLAGKIGTFSKFSTAYNFVGKIGEYGGTVGNYGTVISMGVNVQQYKDGEISRARLDYRLVTTLGTAVAATYGAVPGGIAAGSAWAGEQSYDGFNTWLDATSKVIADFNHAVSNGWYPGKQ